jgi:hypothetical protein
MVILEVSTKKRLRQKSSFNNSLMQGERNEVWWANFPKAIEA